MAKYLIFKNEEGLWTWALVDPNGHVIASGANFGTESAAHNNVRAVRKFSTKAQIISK